MKSIQALREQRAAIAKELQDLIKKPSWDDAVDKPVYDTGMAKIESIDAEINRIENVNRITFENGELEGIIDVANRVSKDTGSQSSAVFAKWLKGGDTALNQEDWAAIRNTMSTTTGSEGGFTVPTEVASTVVDALKLFGGMRAVANIIRTEAGNDMNWPTSDGTAELGELLSQNVAAGTGSPVFGTLPLPVYKYSSRSVAVPIELLQDSTVDIEAFVTNRLVQRLGRITNQHFTVGSGSGQPNGVVTAAGVGVTGATGTTLTVTYDSLVDLQHSVDPAYRDLGNCRFMMNDDSVKVVKKIKDTQGRPIFLPGYDPANNGKLDTLLGHAIQVNQSVAVMAANAKSILFGDFQNYVIRDALDIQMMRFTDSAYATKGQVGFLAMMRSGGNLMDVGGAIKAYRNSAT
jgi:HK97 family phage major capsid protein